MRFRRIGRAGAMSALCGVLTIASAVQASEPEPLPLEAAEQSLLEGRPDAACAILYLAYGAEPEEARALQLLAECAEGLGRPDVAIFYLETLLARAPETPGARAELGLLYAQTGRHEEARVLLAQAMEAEPESVAAPFIEDLLRSAAQDDPAAYADALQRQAVTGRFQGEVTAGLLYDSNVNAGPGAQTAAAIIGGVPVDLVLAPGSRPQKSWGFNTSAALRYLQPLSSNYALLFQGSGARTQYFSAHDFDTTSLGGAAALLYRSGTFEASVQPNVRYTRQDMGQSETLYGLSLRAGEALSQDVRATAGLSVYRRDVDKFRSRNATGISASLGLVYNAGETLDLGAGFAVRDENARDDIYSLREYAPSVYAVWTVTPEFYLIPNYKYARTNYEKRQPIFAEKREDRQHALSLYGEWDVSRFTVDGLSVTGQANYARNRSSLTVNDHKRTVMSGGLRLRF